MLYKTVYDIPKGLGCIQLIEKWNLEIFIRN